MSSSLRRGTLAATTLVLAAAALSACGAGFGADSLEVKPNTAGATVGNIEVQNITIVTQTSDENPSAMAPSPSDSDTPSGTATASPTSSPAAGRQVTAAVTGRVFNNGDKPQTLKSITVAGARTKVRLRPAEGGSLTVPAGGSLALGGRGHASAVLTGAAAKAVRDGNAQPVTFVLSSTGSVRVRALVVPARGDYEKFGPSETPSAGANDDGEGGETGKGGKPADSAGGTPSGSGSESPAGGPDSGVTQSGKPGDEGSAQ